MTDRSLLLFTLGPVQEFIAAGRRTADLWAGSTLLSHLAATAVRAVEQEVGPAAFLFPARKGENDKNASLPNRFLVEVDTARVAELARAAEEAARSELHRVARFALEQAGLAETHAPAADEVAQFLEVAWAAVPLSDALDGELQDWPTTDRHARSYRLVEMLAGARKALRDFPGGGATEDLEGWPQGEPGLRCTLMPALPALVERPGQGPAEATAWWSRLARRAEGRIRPEERLSAVALAKRFFPLYVRARAEDDAFEAFPSTSSFAVADFLKDVLERAAQHEPLRKAAQRFDEAVAALPSAVERRYREQPVPGVREAAEEAAAIGQLHFRSGDLLAGDPLTPEAVERHTGGSVEIDALATLNAARRGLLDAAEKAGVDPPSRYYAVLVLDGDHMGRWLSGEKEPKAFGDSAGGERHRTISRRLRCFASGHVPRIVEKENLGRLVYSGGDDVVALFSFRTALGAARAIERAFKSAFHAAATASAGLVFAHHMTNLQTVLDEARAAEKAAKRAGRDRLTITALKRSGDPARVTLPWHHLEPLVVFAELIRTGQVATGYAYDLAETLRLLQGPNAAVRNGKAHDAGGGGNAFPEDLRKPFEAEARRVFHRRAERIPKEERDARFHESVGRLLELCTPDVAVAALHVAQFMGKGGDR